MVAINNDRMQHFNRDKLNQFKVAYRKAINSGAESFLWDGKEWHTRYAHYVIEYLEQRLE